MSAKVPPHSVPITRLFWIPPALLLISASLSKSAYPLPFLYELADYNLSLSIDVESGLALMLPAAEMLLGMILLLRRARWAAVGAALLLISFSSAIILGLPAGYLHRCGCLGPEDLNPVMALVKNALMILLLGGGFIRTPRTLLGENPWGAFALIAGGTWSGGMPFLIICGIAAFLAAADGKKHLLSFSLALLLGLGLKFFNFPLIALPLLGTVIYLWGIKPLTFSRHTPFILSIGILVITTSRLLWAPVPEVSPPLLQVEEIWPDELTPASQYARDERHQSLVIFLQPDCDECRYWLPRAISLSRRRDLPPLVGLAPGSEVRIQNYRRQEGIPFPVLSVGGKFFDHAVRRTPLLVLVAADTVRHIFSEGSLPSASAVEAIIENESQ